MSFIKRPMIAAVFSVLALNTGCATIVHGGHQRIPVTSVPSGAHVFLDGSEVGATPMEVQIKRSHLSHTIEVRQDGYEPVGTIIRSTPCGLPWVNVIYGFVGIPFILVDAATGANIDMEPEKVDSQMTPIPYPMPQVSHE